MSLLARDSGFCFARGGGCIILPASYLFTLAEDSPMSRRLATTMAVALVIVGLGPGTQAGDKDEAIKNDLKLLQGTWLIQSVEVNGKPVPGEKVKNITLTI